MTRRSLLLAWMPFKSCSATLLQNGEEGDGQDPPTIGQLDASGKQITRKKKSDVGERTVINPDCQFYFRWLFMVTACNLYNMWTPIVRQVTSLSVFGWLLMASLSLSLSSFFSLSLFLSLSLALFLSLSSLSLSLCYYSSLLFFFFLHVTFRTKCIIQTGEILGSV